MISIPCSLKELFVLEITSVFYCVIFIFFLKIYASGYGLFPPSPLPKYILVYLLLVDILIFNETC